MTEHALASCEPVSDSSLAIALSPVPSSRAGALTLERQTSRRNTEEHVGVLGRKPGWEFRRDHQQKGQKHTPHVCVCVCLILTEAGMNAVHPEAKRKEHFELPLCSNLRVPRRCLSLSPLSAVLSERSLRVKKPNSHEATNPRCQRTRQNTTSNSTAEMQLGSQGNTMIVGAHLKPFLEPSL